jgi:uncharacterized membrane protein YeaQ/YmgE (transglycosylase-associated protein family)
MAGIGWFMAIILGGIAGWIAEKIMKSDMGLLANIGLGIVGAIVANFLLSLVLGGTVGAGSWIMQLIVAVVGACLLIWIARLIRGRTA